jgi:hypothetical protein
VARARGVDLCGLCPPAGQRVAIRSDQGGTAHGSGAVRRPPGGQSLTGRGALTVRPGAQPRPRARSADRRHPARSGVAGSAGHPLCWDGQLCQVLGVSALSRSLHTSCIVDPAG